MAASAIGQAFLESREVTDPLIAQGYANHPLPLYPYYFPFIQGPNVAITLDKVIGSEKFLIRHAAAAIDLMESCGWARRMYKEMWTQVYVRGEMVGWMWLWRAMRRPGISLGDPRGGGNASVS